VGIEPTNKGFADLQLCGISGLFSKGTLLAWFYLVGFWSVGREQTHVKASAAAAGVCPLGRQVADAWEPGTKPRHPQALEPRAAQVEIAFGNAPYRRRWRRP